MRIKYVKNLANQRNGKSNDTFAKIGEIYEVILEHSDGVVEARVEGYNNLFWPGEYRVVEEKYLVVYKDTTNKPEWKVLEGSKFELEQMLDVAGAVVNWNGNNKDVYVIDIE